MVEICFVLAEGQNRFFVELIDAIRVELDDAGVPSSVHVGAFPEHRPGIVTVLVPPHEYFALTEPDDRPTAEQLARTVMICAEQPGTWFFDRDVELGASAGAVLDIHSHSIRHFHTQGVKAEHFALGWTRAWCHAQGLESENEPATARDVDVLHLGINSARRGRVVSGYGRQLEPWRAHLQFGDDHRPLAGQAVNAVFDDRKWRLLARSRVLLNIHVDDRPYFEWLRIVQAICNGTYVVTEHSDGIEPLIAGEHLTVGSAESLGLLMQPLLEDESERLWRARAAYHFLKRELPLAASIERLVELAVDIDGRRPRKKPEPVIDHLPAPRPYEPPEREVFPSGWSDPDISVVRQALKDVRLEFADLRRQLSRLEIEARTGDEVPAIVLDRDTPAWAAARARVSVITALYNYENHIKAALESVARGQYGDIEFVIVDDGSTDGSRRAVHRFMERHRGFPIRLLRHPVNRGLGPARNAALDVARGEFVFILDADNLVYRHGVARHVEALDADPSASFAYGTVGMFTTDGPHGILSQYGWNPQRLRRGNYIDAMAMWRRSAIDALDGYVTDRRLWGWEDYDLWCRAAEAGHRGVHVPEILTRYRVARHSMLSLTNISSTTAVSVLSERAPRLMAGVDPPL
jgi:hypothetical protein